MAERQTRTGQLDQISEAIGGLRESVKGIERYMHDREHGLNNLSQKFDALGVRIAKDMAAVEGRIQGQVKAMDDRLLALERAREREEGAKGIVVWFLQSPVIGWLFLGAVALWAYLTGKVKP
jgi:hypothetical protein